MSDSLYCAYCFGSGEPLEQAGNGRWYHPDCKAKDRPLNPHMPPEVGGRGGQAALEYRRLMRDRGE